MMNQDKETLTRSSILPRQSIPLTNVYLLAVAILLPIARPYLPGNTILLDWVNIIFLPILWLQIFLKKRTLRFPLFYPMFLLFFAGLLPLFNHSYSSVELSLTFLFKEMYLYIWFLTMVNIIGKKLPKHLLMVFVLSATVIAIIVIVQWASPQFLKATTYLPQEIQRSTLLGGSRRPLGLFRNPAMMGNYLAFSVFLLIGSPVWRRKRLRWIVAGCLVIGIIASGAYGAIMMLIVGASIVCWLHRRYLLAPAILVRLVIGVIVIGSTIFVLRSNFLQTEAGILFRQRYVMQRIEMSYNQRIDIWKPAIESFIANPLGIGPGLFFHKEQGRFLYIHNDYLAMLIERGVLGGIGMIWLLISILRLIPSSDIRRVNSSSISKLYRAILMGALVAMLVGSLSINIFRFRQFWFLLFLIVQANESFKPLMNRKSVT